MIPQEAMAAEVAAVATTAAAAAMMSLLVRAVAGNRHACHSLYSPSRVCKVSTLRPLHHHRNRHRLSERTSPCRLLSVTAMEAELAVMAATAAREGLQAEQAQDSHCCRE